VTIRTWPRSTELLAAATWIFLAGVSAASCGGGDSSTTATSSGGQGGTGTGVGAGGTGGSSGGAPDSGTTGTGGAAGRDGSSTGGSAGTGGGAGAGGATGGGAGAGGTAGSGGFADAARDTSADVSRDASAGSGGTTADGGVDVPPPPPGDAGGGFYRVERLNRGVVAVVASGGIYVGWRMFGDEHDPANPAAIAYNVYRDGTKIATVTDSTNYRDMGGTGTSVYSVRAVTNGVEQGTSENATPWAQNYLRIPLQVPPGGTTPGSPQCTTANEAYTYSANDGSVGDVDGDGQYEIFIKWDPSNAKDNSQSGCTGNVYIDAYKLDGTRLYRIDLGRNIRAGAHYTQFIVYDFDGDGKAEMAVKTAPGTQDGTGQLLNLGPAATDDDNADYRSVSNTGGRTGFVLTGPEYLTVFNGQTGAEMATVAFDVPRGTVSAWGDDYGNRVDRFLATAAYLDNTGYASFVMARGYYTRTTLTAWNFRGGQLSQLWKFDSNTTPTDGSGKKYTGQGSHSLSVANIDADLGQEIIYGAMAIDHDGKGKCSTGYDHGDALHVSDFIPSRPGLEAFMPNEDGLHPTYHLRDPDTCAIITEGPIVAGQDTGRAVAADVFPDNPGAEMWAAGGTPLLDTATGKNLGAAPGSINFVIWWDADESRELEDGTSITKYGGSALQSCSECSANNGTKSNPTLTADLLGDWREEIIWRETNSAGLRLYTTTALTTRRIFTLMHDPQYRIAISWQNVAYNQPPHPSFHIGNGMAVPPRPNIIVR
jgi:rhamnogalacturonan endolyase